MKLIRVCLLFVLSPACALSQGWSVQETTSQDLFSVSFVDANNGWAVGTGQVLHTSNGGIDWIGQQAFADPVFHSVFFIDPNIGWTVGEGKPILHTEDGGATWVQQRPSLTTSFLSVFFIDANVGWVVGTIGTILHTTDGGETWNTQAGGGGIYYFLNAVRFVDANTGWAVGGGVGAGGLILHTTDGGITWTEQVSGTDNTLTSVCFVDENTGWVVGYEGTIIRTSDGGSTWIHQSSGTGVSLESVQFTDANRGWCVGSSGIILHTSDRGSTWTIQGSPTAGKLLAVSFSDNNLGWSVERYGGVIINTTTGGTGVEAPNATTLSFPLDSSTVSTPLTLSWKPAFNVLWYTLQISTGRYFLTSVLNKTNISETSYTVDSLGLGVTYYWRVSLTDDSGTSNWSDVWSFTIGSSSSDPLAQFDVCYGATGSADLAHPGALITIDPAIGAGTLIGPTGIIGTNGPSVPVLAIKSTGEMYALSATTNSDLYTINASTGAGTFVANTGLVSPDALAFDKNDVLYAVANSNNLYTVDASSGVLVLVGPTGFETKALSYDPTDGTMYGSSLTDEIYTIDLATGSSTLVGTTGLGGPTHALRFEQDGNLFGTKGNASNPYALVAIDKATGQGVTIGSIGFEGVLGLASRVLYSPVGIPCNDITSMAARCIGGDTKTIQVRVNLVNSIIHAGEDITIAIDESQYTSTIITNGTHSRANFSVPGWSVGDHVVSLVDPPGCLADKHANCVVGDSPAKADPYWDDDAEWNFQSVPQATELLGNYPNPFNPSTTFRYGLSEPGQVTLSIYDMLGQLVKTIVNDFQSKGYHEAIWDGKNESGTGVASGIYVYRMTAGNFTSTKRMLLLK